MSEDKVVDFPAQGGKQPEPKVNKVPQTAALQEEVLIIALGPMGLVIGRLMSAAGESLWIRAPRVIQAEPTKSGVVSVTLHELLGKPEEITLIKVGWWKVLDPEMRKIYLEKTTGLTLMH